MSHRVTVSLPAGTYKACLQLAEIDGHEETAGHGVPIILRKAARAYCNKNHHRIADLDQDGESHGETVPDSLTAFPRTRNGSDSRVGRDD